MAESKTEMAEIFERDGIVSIKKNVTMSDIAKRLHVSTVTVSKALSDKDGVSQELRTKIKQLAQQMGYRYHTVAKAMKEGITYNIGIVVIERFFNFTNSFYLNMYQQMIKHLTRHKYYGILEIISLEMEENLQLPNMLQDSKVDGLIALGQLHGNYMQKLKDTGIPLIMLDFYDKNIDADSITSDNFYGSYMVTNYLIENGHRDIAYVGDIYATSSILDRYLGYMKALLESRLELRPDWVIKDRDAQGWIGDITLPKEMPTAFVCNCDQTAYQLVNVLLAQGWKVPDDISVVGFDNYMYATLTVPHLTTVEVETEEMVCTAVEAMVRKIREPGYRLGRKVIGGRLIVRDSVRKRE